MSFSHQLSVNRDTRSKPVKTESLFRFFFLVISVRDGVFSHTLMAVNSVEAASLPGFKTSYLVWKEQ